MPVRLSSDERQLYDDVTDFVRHAWGMSTASLPLTAKLTLIVLQREIGSSTFATARTLSKLQDSPLFGSEERERLRDLAVQAMGISENVKASHLRTFLRSTDEKTLVFTQYVRTMEHLRGILETDGFSVAAYYGGLPPAAKDEAVRAFRANRQVFLSTEAGGEGRNLQFARTLVNYDLPWNPLRIEQRIGRVHRLGQDREVHVVNLWAEDTIEEYLIELLDRKIHMFELVVGELDLILGDLEEKKSFEDLLIEIWTLKEAEARRAALRRLGDALVKARSQYDAVRERNEVVLGPMSEEAVG
jgi:SNF2 family DNA or RNA helicase